MGIGIDDHDFDVGSFILEIANCDSDVVEDAVALAVFSEGVVGSTGKADADAFAECGIASTAGGFDFGCGAGKEMRTCRQAEEYLFLAIQFCGLDFFDIRAVVNTEYMVEINGGDFDNFLRAENVFREKHFL